jgi:hypothetical protein
MHVRDEGYGIIPRLPVRSAGCVYGLIYSFVYVYRDETEKRKRDKPDPQKYFEISFSLHAESLEYESTQDYFLSQGLLSAMR